MLFLENTGVRAPHDARPARACASAFATGGGARRVSAQERPNLFVYSPLVLPLPVFACSPMDQPMAADARPATVDAASPASTGRSSGRSCRRRSPLDLIRTLDPQLTVYYCIDDFASSSPGAKRIVASEQRLFREADLVFVTSERLRAARGGVQRSRSPVSVRRQLRAVRRGAATRRRRRPTMLRSLPRPLIGYVGGLHQWVDQDLVAAVARRLPDATLALIGPVQTDVSALERVPEHPSARAAAARRAAALHQRVRRRHRAVPARRNTPRTSTRRS